MSSTPNKVRVRFAPSPTGYLHVGGARALLFNYLYAKKTDGTLVLRVEDTDRERSKPEYEVMQLKGIDELHLTADESPSKPGDVGPYRQSERMQIYGEHAKKLWDQGKAYPCFCSEELLTQKREAALKLGKIPQYDGTCRNIPAADSLARIKAGEKSGLRFKVEQKSVIHKDAVKGEIEFKDGMVGDFFITRSPTDKEQSLGIGIGMPVYNFCCVVDDHLMDITHVIRGEDHLSNTARQLMIYQAYGWEPPIFAHTATVLGADRQKLSKRNGDTSVHDYLEKGYMPEALLNFLVLLGWWPNEGFKPVSGHPEILTMAEMVSQFTIEGCQKSPAVFDNQKLQWMNGFYLKHYPIEDIAERAKPYFEKRFGAHPKLRDKTWFHECVDLIRGEVSLLSELPEAAKVFFEDEFSPEEDAKKALLESTSDSVVTSLANLVSQSLDISPDVANEIIQKTGADTKLKGKALFMPIRAVTTGKAHGPELKRVLSLLGAQRIQERILKAREQGWVKG